MGVTRCGSRAVGSGLRWGIVVGVCLRGGLSCVPIWQCPRRTRGVDLVRVAGAVSVISVSCFLSPPVFASSPFPVGVVPPLSCSECWWPTGGSLPPCCVARSALFPWVCARHLVSLPVPLPRAFPLPFTFMVPW